jgi:DNA mismatch repair protein MutL
MTARGFIPKTSLAVASHATSKLREADDLFRVQDAWGSAASALASIAEVSRFRIRSRRHDQPTGAEIEVLAGVHGPVRPCGSPAGTLIEVRDLFSNTPVRRKFLRQPATEFGHVSEQFTKIALAHPRLHLVLRHNDRPVYELPAAESCSTGSICFSAAIGEESDLGRVGIRAGTAVGLRRAPSLSKATRKGHPFLNGRWIQDRSLQHALGEAYRGLAHGGRNPVTFLFLEMPADLVDVNVHPTKDEVRFRESEAVPPAAVDDPDDVSGDESEQRAARPTRSGHSGRCSSRFAHASIPEPPERAATGLGIVGERPVARLGSPGTSRSIGLPPEPSRQPVPSTECRVPSTQYTVQHVGDGCRGGAGGFDRAVSGQARGRRRIGAVRKGSSQAAGASGFAGDSGFRAWTTSTAWPRL